jgi:phosphohistidine phosphatase
MQILVIRHAHAEDAVFPGGSDATRELTPKGRKLFTEFVERLIKPASVPDMVLHSPLVRTTQTAEILAQTTSLRPDQVRMEQLMAPGTPAARVVSGLSSIQVDRLALVGHNPDVGLLASHLIGGGSFDFKKGSIACIDLDGDLTSGSGRLVWFASPKLFVKD